MTVHLDCGQIEESICDYAEGTLSAEERVAVEAHLRTCGSCRKEMEHIRKVRGLLSGSLNGVAMSRDFASKTGDRLKAVTTGPVLALVPGDDRLEGQPVAAESALDAMLVRWGGAPWWMISVAFHVLLIALLSLITMAIGTPGNNEIVIVATMERTPQIQPMADEPKKKDALRDVLDSNRDTPATDPDSQTASNIVVPPDILAKAELGDHFETINPDRPDTHSAFGNPDARMFHSESGNDEPEGGGGMGGLSLSDDLIGVGGANSPGTGGGWGGGNGTGTGIGNGSGHGSFGQRDGGGRRLMVMRHGGSKATESSVDKALDWLAKHQEADGHWDYTKYEENSHRNLEIRSGDIGITGAALLAFLGAGHSEVSGKYKDNVKRAMQWLAKELGEKNRWSNGQASNYAQGVAAMAMAEASGMSRRNADFRKAAQRAVDGVIEGQIKDGLSEFQAWDYAPNGRTNDTSATGWNILALKSAKIAGLHVDPASMAGAMRWINAAQDLTNAPKDGDADYWEGGMVAYRGTLDNANQLGRWMSVTAIGAATRLFVGGEKPTHPGVAGPCNLMKRPENLPTQGNDLYYWYYGTLVMFQKGGDHWNAWNKAMRVYLVQTQRKDGDFDGSFDPSIASINGVKIGGRVFSTALGAMCLEVYYRYLPLYR